MRGTGQCATVMPSQCAAIGGATYQLEGRGDPVAARALHPRPIKAAIEPGPTKQTMSGRPTHICTGTRHICAGVCLVCTSRCVHRNVLRRTLCGRRGRRSLHELCNARSDSAACHLAPAHAHSVHGNIQHGTLRLCVPSLPASTYPVLSGTLWHWHSPPECKECTAHGAAQQSTSSSVAHFGASMRNTELQLVMLAAALCLCLRRCIVRSAPTSAFAGGGSLGWRERGGARTAEQSRRRSGSCASQRTVPAQMWRGSVSAQPVAGQN